MKFIISNAIYIYITLYYKCIYCVIICIAIYIYIVCCKYKCVINVYVICVVGQLKKSSSFSTSFKILAAPG